MNLSNLNDAYKLFSKNNINVYKYGILVNSNTMDVEALKFHHSKMANNSEKCYNFSTSTFGKMILVSKNEAIFAKLHTVMCNLLTLFAFSTVI